jgi:exodeoxyribonuclease VII large subunit
MLLARLLAFREPGAYARRRAQDVDRLSERMTEAFGRGQEGRRHRLANASAKLDALSPLGILKRGYSLARTARGVVRGADEIAAGDLLRVVFGKGEADCRVESVRAERGAGPGGGVA